MSKIYFYLGLVLLIASCSQESDLQLNLQQSETFLLNNLTNDQVILIEEGLQYSIIQSGDTNTIPPALSETITAHFHGTLMDGTVFGAQSRWVIL
jgi:FKBP-type peptidyl-prolyl cis-trans isomerase